jgi:hypothetical protein
MGRVVALLLLRNVIYGICISIEDGGRSFSGDEHRLPRGVLSTTSRGVPSFRGQLHATSWPDDQPCSIGLTSPIGLRSSQTRDDLPAGVRFFGIW